MKKTNFSIVLLLFLCASLYAQAPKATIPTSAKVVHQATKSPEYSTVLAGEINPISVDLQWRPVLTNLNRKHHSEVEDETIEAIKEQKAALKRLGGSTPKSLESTDDVATVTPVIGVNFAANINGGSSPMDNSMAISNGGKIVSVANGSINFYSQTGSLTYTNTIESFFNDATISNTCDPVVVYDSGADRFIFFAQECSGNSSNSKLLICFSKSNNPNGGWWKYKFNGDPAGLNNWFDYPKLGLSTNELYITGNSFSNGGSFQEPLLYQIQKANGYSGGSISWQYWNNISPSAFTLMPVSWGQQGNYGPGCYLVATHSAGSSAIELFDLTDDMTATNETLNHYTISTTAYSPAGDGNQLGTSRQLDNGDCRALSGFFLNGIIHFVFHSDYSGGYNGINYNRLTISTQTNTSSKFGLTNYEYSYPSVASFATTTTDKSVMVGFGRTGSTIYPEMRVVNCDNAMAWSGSVRVKAGEGYTDFTASGSSPERWGDYTGMSRKHNNATSSVWMNGMFGTTANNWDSWVAEINDATVNIEDTKTPSNSTMQVYPNPAFREFKTEFDLLNDQKISIDIYDIQGRLVKNLFTGTANVGKNIFTFDKTNLQSGSYIITISTTNQQIKNEKIIIAN